MINTTDVWDYISQHSVSNYRRKMEALCYDYSNQQDTSFITDNRTETDKAIFINLCLNNKEMVDLNVKFVKEYGNPFELVIRNDNYGGHTHRGSMMYSKFKVDFKYWKDSGTIDIVLNRYGVTEKYNYVNQEHKWKYYKIRRQLKITKDNVWFFKGKSIRNATLQNINNMVFASMYPDKEPKILLNLLYGGPQHYGYSVKKTREKEIYTIRKALTEIHKVFESEEITDKMLELISVNRVRYMFKRFKHRDLVNTIKTYLELVKNGSMDTVYYNNYCNKVYNNLTNKWEFTNHDIQPPIIRKFEETLSIHDLGGAFIPLGYGLTYEKPKRKLGLHTVLTKENCKDYGLEYYENIPTMSF